MNRQSVPLPDFLASLSKDSSFPKDKLCDYLNRTSPSKKECLAALANTLDQYHKNVLSYKEPAVAIWICAMRNLQEGMEQSLSFFLSLMQSRLLLLVFDMEGQFVLGSVLKFIEESLEVLIRKALQFNFSGVIIEMLKGMNTSRVKFNEILFLLEMIFIRKIQKQLDQQSQQEFNQVLKDILPAIKLERIQQHTDALKFRLIAIMRAEEDSCDSYQLQLKEGKLAKQPEIANLPQWVLQAYVKPPRPIDLSLFNSKKVIDVFNLLSHAEVYASSGLIQDLQQLIQDDNFQLFFQKFLLGQPLGSGKYQFSCQSIQRTLQALKQQFQSQNVCYRSAIASQLASWTGE